MSRKLSSKNVIEIHKCIHNICILSFRKRERERERERDSDKQRERLDRILSTLVGNSKKESYGLKFLRFRHPSWYQWLKFCGLAAGQLGCVILWKTAVKTEL